MTFLAAASSALRRVLAGPARPAACLGVARGALYLRITEPPGALALLCRDAVRLPCGLLLPATSQELSFPSLAAPSASFMVGDHAVRWTGPAGPVVVHAVREWAPRRAARGEVDASALAAARSALGLDESRPGEQTHRHVDGSEFAIALGIANSLPRPEDLYADAELLGHQDFSVAAARLLGRGPGLTPAGDDVLAGFLVGAVAFGVDAAGLRDAIAVQAPAGTTALSAALLWHAARGECIDELAALAAVLTVERSGPELAEHVVARLVSVGHSSGAALALGLLTAADSAVRGSGGLAA